MKFIFRLNAPKYIKINYQKLKNMDICRLVLSVINESCENSEDLSLTNTVRKVSDPEAITKIEVSWWVNSQWCSRKKSELDGIRSKERIYAQGSGYTLEYIPTTIAYLRNRSYTVVFKKPKGIYGVYPLLHPSKWCCISTAERRRNFTFRKWNENGCKHEHGFKHE